mmetsp:Transcript_2084/g.6901  ORF Transcript_2084/g.6901 Transcript_2084/m.6901 type:complete len:411 (+) Transcript_2084:145-1377(+)
MRSQSFEGVVLRFRTQKIGNLATRDFFQLEGRVLNGEMPSEKYACRAAGSRVLRTRMAANSLTLRISPSALGRPSRVTLRTLRFMNRRPGPGRRNVRRLKRRTLHRSSLHRVIRLASLLFVLSALVVRGLDLHVPVAVSRLIPRAHRELRRNLVDWSALLDKARLEERFSRGVSDVSNVNIRVIVLTRVRRNVTLDALAQQGLDYQIFEAIDGLEDINPELIDMYAGRKKKRRLAVSARWSALQRLEVYRTYMAGELRSTKVQSALHERLRFGCYISHVSLWKEVVRKGLPYLVVLEDDVYVEDNFVFRLKHSLQSLPASWGLLYLNGSHRKFGLPYTPSIVQSKGGVGAFGYVISASACAHFLAGPILKSDKAIDHVMDEEVLTGRLSAFHMNAPLVHVARHLKSTLAY